MKDLLAAPRDTASYSGVYQGIVAEDAITSDDQIHVIIPAISQDYQYGPCRWVRQGGFGDQLGALDGEPSTPTTAVLYGSGRTTLISTDHLAFSVIAIPSLAVVQAATSAGISLISPDVYLKDFIRPASAGRYAVKWTADTISPALDLFTVGNVGAGSTSLPSIGDLALVVFDNYRIPYVIAWWSL